MPRAEGRSSPGSSALGSWLWQHTKRYFEFVAGTSSKFWEVADKRQRHDDALGPHRQQRTEQDQIVQGRGDGATQAEKLIAEKTADGYVEKSVS